MTATAASLPSLLMTYLTGSGTTKDADEAAQKTTPEAGLDDAVDRQLYPEPTSTPVNTRHRPILPYTPTSGRATAPPSPTKSFLSIPIGDENMSYVSDDVSRDGLSREGSFMSSTNGKSKKRTAKPKTSYSICHPPPKPSARSKIHVRARPLLQLHRLEPSSRPMPAFEVLPSAIFSPSLSRAIAKVFRTRHGLCPADLAVVKADRYHQNDDTATEEDETRNVLALICKGRKADGLAPGRAKMLLGDGTEWEAYGLSNGGYEFTSIDEHGLTTTVRWVLKRPRGRRSQSASELDSPRLMETVSKKFNFSTISPNSRRHPVIANLTSTTLDIQDFYNIPSATSSILTPPATPSSLLAEDNGPGVPVETTANLRTLITTSAVWVALREGWTPGYKYEDSLMRSPSSKLNASPIRASTDMTDNGKDNGPQRSGSVARILRSASNLRRRSAASAMTDGSSEPVIMSRNSSVRSTSTTTKTRARAESTSTVIVHRTTWPRPDMRAMRKNTGASTSTHLFGIDTTGDMTEEEEGDLESAETVPVATPKRQSAPTPLLSSSTRTPSPAKNVSTPSPAKNSTSRTPKEQKRESSGTDMTIESKKLEADLQPKRKRRSFRALFCGMA